MSSSGGSASNSASSSGSSSNSGGSSRSSGLSSGSDSSGSWSGGDEPRLTPMDKRSPTSDPNGVSDIGLTDDEIGIKYRVPAKTVKKYRKAFDLYDQDHNQFIEARELKLVLKQLGQDSSAANVQQMLSLADQDADNRVNFSEFVQMMANVEKMHLRELHVAFSVFDSDKSGFIDEKELGAVMASLGKPISGGAIRTMLAEADTNHDGRVSFEEFARILGYDGQLYSMEELVTELADMTSSSSAAYSDSDGESIDPAALFSTKATDSDSEGAPLPEGHVAIKVHAFYLGLRYKVVLPKHALFGALAAAVAESSGYAVQFHRFYYEGLLLEHSENAGKTLSKLGINGTRPVFFIFLTGKFVVASADILDKDRMPRLDAMYDIFRKEEQIPTADALDIVDRARALFRDEPNLVELWEPLSVIGDIHGQFFDLEEVFKVAGRIDGRRTQLFLGDYVDRGYFSCEVILFLFAAKIKYPKSVYLLRGNHESRKTTEKYGTLAECRIKYGKKFYQRLMLAFDALPLYALVHAGDHRILMMHGGLSHRIESLDQIEDIARNHEPPQDGALKDCLWTDPSDDNRALTTAAPRRKWDLKRLKRRQTDVPDAFEDAHFKPCERGSALKTFSHDAVLAFLKRNDLLSIFRAHEQKADGFELYKYGPKFKFPGVVTIFSAPNYTDKSMNEGCVVTIAGGHIQFHSYKWRLHPLYFDHSRGRLALTKDLVQEDLIQFLNWLHPQVLRRLPLHTLHEEFYEMFAVDRTRTKGGRSGQHLWTFLDDNLAEVMHLCKDKKIRAKYKKKTLAMMLWYQGFDCFSEAVAAESVYEKDVTGESKPGPFSCGRGGSAKSGARPMPKPKGGAKGGKATAAPAAAPAGAKAKPSKG